MTPKATQGSVMPDELIGRSALIAVIGAGTMGAGIAQVAAVAGHPVIVYDTVPGAADRAVRAIGERITGLVAKGRLDVDPDGCDWRWPASSASWPRRAA
jgi:hypothetical protein